MARAYLALGYRGFLSLDSVVTAESRVAFTEANARFTSSTHLYERIAHAVVRAAESPKRVVVQTLSPPAWQLRSLQAFIEILSREGLAYDPSSRCGVMAVTPVVHGSGQLLLAAVAENERAAAELTDALACGIRRPDQSGRTT